MTLSRQFWMAVRQALLSIVEALEKELDISPTTAEIRRAFKSNKEQGA